MYPPYLHGLKVYPTALDVATPVEAAPSSSHFHLHSDLSSLALPRHPPAPGLV